MRSVLVIHTNLPWLYPEALNEQPWYYNFLQKLLTNISIYRADRIIVDSNTAKRELIDIFPKIYAKTKRVYLGIDQKKFKKSNKNIQISNRINIFKEEYFLTVSSVTRYHCFLELIDAYKKFFEKNHKVPKLLFVSNVISRSYYKEVLQAVKKSGLSANIIFITNLKSGLLPTLYQNSELYIFSSYCEVFGFTNLEAMACGIPVLTSDKSALPEICQDAAMYFDPFDSVDIYEKINFVFNNKKIQRSLIEKGYNQVNKYPWETTVKETFEILS